MNENTHWSVLFYEHKYPCFLAEIQSHKVLALNQEMELLLQSPDAAVGKRFYEVITNDNATYTNDFSLNWQIQSSFHYQIYNKALDKDFSVTNQKIEINSVEYNFCKYVPTEAKSLSYEEAMLQCIRLLESEAEQHKTAGILGILGEYYQCDKAILYQVEPEQITALCHWKKDDSIQITQNLMTKLEQDTVTQWLEKRNEVGIADASKDLSSYEPDSLEGHILKTFALDNVVMGSIENSEKEVTGIVVLGNRRNLEADSHFLQGVTCFLEKDVSQQKQSAQLIHQQQQDWLTGCKSRGAYSKKVMEFEENPPKILGIVFVNINGLKAINSEFGLAKGDSYIKKAAKIIQDYFQTEFYRISGDEFVTFIQDENKESFESKVLHLPDHLQEEDYFSLGHAWASGRPQVIDLMKEAETVMYINKQNYYHRTHRLVSDISDTTLHDLLHYLEQDEFMIYLQAQVRLEDNSLYGAEALIRRFDKTNQKMVFPDQFIPLYEKKSVIRHVDIFVVEEVCALLAQWQTRGRMIPISVNLSRVTLQEYGIVQTIAEICDRHQIPREYVVIEVTERVGLIEKNVASTLIQEFTDNGFKISLDDFGCAYSNIVTLAQIEVDEVKLDKSLVDYLTSNLKNYVLVKNVLSMCNELDSTSTLAEGIEEEAQAKMLKELGCHLGQGYYYSRPIPVAEFTAKYMQGDQV